MFTHALHCRYLNFLSIQHYLYTVPGIGILLATKLHKFSMISENIWGFNTCMSMDMVCHHLWMTTLHLFQLARIFYQFVSQQFRLSNIGRQAGMLNCTSSGLNLVCRWN